MTDPKTILIVNPGSTSLKFKLFIFPEERILATGAIERIGEEESNYSFRVLRKSHKGSDHIPDCKAGVELILDSIIGQESAIPEISDLDAIGFKTVHAGLKSLGPGAVFLDHDIMREMRRFLPVSPLHNRIYINVIESFREIVPDVPRAGLFEPTFHNTVTEEKFTCGLPFDWRDKYGIRRYGFHGASHRFIAEHAPDVVGWNSERRRGAKIVSCHLGGSSSLCAIQNAKSVDTTMEFSPQSGILHSSRCETIDPFILIFAQEEMGLSHQELSDILCHESGLKGVSGISGDMRDIRHWVGLGNERARLALDMFHHQVRKQIAAMCASMDGMDLLVFTGGIGTHSPEDRGDICDGLQFLGIQLDEEKNVRTRAQEGEISLVASPTAVWVIPTNEEIIVGREVFKLISGD